MTHQVNLTAWRSAETANLPPDGFPVSDGRRRAVIRIAAGLSASFTECAASGVVTGRI